MNQSAKAAQRRDPLEVPAKVAAAILVSDGHLVSVASDNK